MKTLLLRLRTADRLDDIVAEFGDDTSVAELAAEIAPDRSDPGTVRVGRTGEILPPHLPASTCDLHSGDVIEVVDPALAADGANPPRRVGARATVLTGANAGETIDLCFGANTIGRGAADDITLDGDLVSRSHGLVLIDEGVRIVDLGSTNGIAVNDSFINRPTRVGPGDALLIGDSVLSIKHFGGKPDLGQVRGNRVEFNRPPRISKPYPGLALDLPQPPDKPNKQRLPMIASLIPMALGVVFLVAFPGNLVGSLFLLMSPIMMMGSAWESKRGGRLDFKEKTEEHRAAVTGVIEMLEQERAVEFAGRHDETPIVGDYTGIVQTLSMRLWEREPADVDFLTARFGTADLPSRSRLNMPQQGDRELLAELAEIPDRFAVAEGVPLGVSLPEVGGIGIAGPPEAAQSVARSIVVQVAGMHSPAELVLCAMVADEVAGQWEWMKWLPHTRQTTSPLGRRHFGSTSHACLELLTRLEGLIAERVELGRDNHNGPAISTPAIVVLIDESLPVERSRLMDLLEHGPAASVFFCWVGGARHRLPKPCGALIEIETDGVSARVGFAATGDVVEPVRFEGIPLPHAEAMACRLAPVVDVSGRGAAGGDIPSQVSLVDLLGGAKIMDRPEMVIERWNMPHGQSLRAPVGQGAGATFSLDIRHDGPHALVGGTTGAGKSETLQSYVASLAATHSPDRITFLLVDYKGGAAFKECVHLPHTVGMVTDLDTNGVRRALISLNAELHHRERILEQHGAKDLVEMEKREIPGTPPSLLIIVDEFAALVQEVPEFVEGVVNVALRGRSLGLHLVLATQRPAGVVTPQIRANTNLRIALRMADDDDSEDVVGSPAAGQIERSLPGRAVARIGPKELIAFQSAYVGGHTGLDDSGPGIAISDFGFSERVAWPSGKKVEEVDPGETDLERMVTVLEKAAQLEGVPAPRKPWQPPMVSSYDLAKLPRSTDDSALVLGVVDDPHHQDQRLVAFHPEVDGSMLIMGTSGSGKTVALRSIAIASALVQSGPAPQVYALDFAGRGLAMLEPLPNVGAVVSGDEHERVVRLFRTIQDEIESRAVRFAQVRAGSLSEYRRDPDGDPDLPRIILMIDSFGGFSVAYDRIEAGKWLDLVPRLLSDGRQVGVHLVMTGNRRSTFPMAIAGSVPRHLVQRLANEDEYTSAGVPKHMLTSTSPPGRGILDDLEVQLAVLGGRPDGDAQATAIDQLAELLRRNDAAEAPPIRVLAEELNLDALPADSDSPASVVFGMADATLGPSDVPIDSHLMISGPRQSGRSTTLATLANRIHDVGHADMHFVSARAVSLGSASWWNNVGMGEEDAANIIRDLTTEFEIEPPPRPQYLFIDDLTELLETDADFAMVDLMRLARSHPIYVIAATESAVARRAYGNAIPDLRDNKRGILLAPDPDFDGDLLGVVLPRTGPPVWPPGRGYVVNRGAFGLVQVAFPDHL
ncbi:MAG: FHA domain-containing protein [Acidimicrobiales bacterium]|nr:FHA domain-containing protein [Acidimicrobiales bacterium]